MESSPPPAYSRRIDAGPWFSAGEQLDAAMASERVINAAAARAASCHPFAVYVHVPFCVSICSFCALYTHGVGTAAEDRFDEYLDAVLRSLESHPWRAFPSAPTTVHFGGGTPLSIGPRRLARLTHGLIDAFGTSASCEWAIETTTSSLDPETVDALEALRFRRVHLGIQTLDDRTRARIGRRESGATAIERIIALENRGFFTSVDLILGLEGVDTATVGEDLRRLRDAGVRMFSICELRERRVKRPDPADEAERAARSFAMWRVVWDFMEAAGLHPIHAGQFARHQADNLYFTHPARGEDCVAIGPYSHGSAGDVSYGNLLLPAYYASVSKGDLPIAIGVDYRYAERVICTFERDLLTHRVSARAVEDMIAVHGHPFEELFAEWLRLDLLRFRAGAGFGLTMQGSWFVGNMIEEVRALAAPGKP